MMRSLVDAARTGAVALRKLSVLILTVMNEPASSLS